MIVFLVGLPGSGKSTLSSQLAESLNYNAIDLDTIIEKEQGKSIANIFAEEGEEFFRALESKTLSTLHNLKDTVVSTGGGTPCFHGNMDVMNRMGVTVFLDTNTEEISTRLQKEDLDKRPLFDGLTIEQTANFLLNLREERLQYYMQSTYTLSDESLSITQLIAKLKS